MELTIQSIAIGKAKEYTVKNKVFTSAYKKDTFKDSACVTPLGLEDDIQVDKEFHGGLDKAIHIGSSKHFDIFEKTHNQELDKLAIGCNIIIDKYDENDICIGDIYTIGEVELEVTQPRQPCWKIGALFGKDINRYIVKQSATGWYVRVLNEGIINREEKMVLKKRISNITIKELSSYLTNPPRHDEKLVVTILSNPALAMSYKDDFRKALRNR